MARQNTISERLLGASLRPLAALAVLALSGCSTPDADTDIHDPYESFNRQVHELNLASDRTFLRPVSKAYGTALPAPVRRSLTNAAENLDTPRSALNDALQGDVEGVIHNTFRFILNTSLGVFGLFDPAKDFGLPDRETGFGDTLAVWGAPEGAYLELPYYGPSTERDAVGEVVDILLNPVGALLPTEAEGIATLSSVPPTINERYEFSDTYDDIFYNSADSYAQLRLFYLDNRRFELRQIGVGEETDAFDPYDDIYGELDFGE